jgi:hypothetical protein
MRRLKRRPATVRGASWRSWHCYDAAPTSDRPFAPCPAAGEAFALIEANAPEQCMTRRWVAHSATSAASSAGPPVDRPVAGCAAVGPAHGGSAVVKSNGAADAPIVEMRAGADARIVTWRRVFVSSLPLDAGSGKTALLPGARLLVRGGSRLSGSTGPSGSLLSCRPRPARRQHPDTASR